MKRLLALDQASRTSGWAVFENDKLLTYGHFSTTSDDIGERLLQIRDAVINLIHSYKIDEIIFEDIQLQKTVGNNVATFKLLAEVFGVIYELATELQIPNRTVLSSVWRSALNINDASKRENQKKNAQIYVLNNFQVKATQDECDAICIGAYGIKKPTAADFNWE